MFKKILQISFVCCFSVMLFVPQPTQASWFSNAFAGLFKAGPSVIKNTPLPQKQPITCTVDFRAFTETCSDKNQNVVTVRLDKPNKQVVFSAGLVKDVIVPTIIKETIFLEKNVPDVTILYKTPLPYKTSTKTSNYNAIDSIEKTKAIARLKQIFDMQQFLGVDSQIEVVVTPKKATASIGFVSLSTPVKTLIPHMDVQTTHDQLYTAINGLSTDFGGWGVSKVVYAFPDILE